MTLVGCDLLLQDGDCVIELSLDLGSASLEEWEGTEDETDIEDFLL